jgi:hypothetical protein
MKKLIELLDCSKIYMDKLVKEYDGKSDVRERALKRYNYLFL